MGKHKAIIRREKKRLVYIFGRAYWGQGMHVGTDYEHVEHVNLWEGELDSPVMECGDQIYINEIDELVTIQDIIRTTNGEYLYTSEPEIVEDEKTEETLEEANAKLKKYEEERREYQEPRMGVEVKNIFRRLLDKIKGKGGR